MGVTVTRAKSPEQQKQEEALARGRYVLTERLVRTRDGVVVPEAQASEGGTFLGPIGLEMPLEEARRLGIVPEIEPAASAVLPEIAAQMPSPEVDPIPSARRKGK